MGVYGILPWEAVSSSLLTRFLTTEIVAPDHMGDVNQS